MHKFIIHRNMGRPASYLLALLWLVSIHLGKCARIPSAIKVPSFSLPKGFSAPSFSLRNNRITSLFENIQWKGVLSRRRYRLLLQEQCQILEQQLRKSENELAQVRKRMKILQDSTSKKMSQNIQYKKKEEETRRLKELRSLRDQIDVLQREISKLQSMKDDFEKLLASEQAKVESLQIKLKNAEEGSSDLIEKYERQIIELQRDMEAKAAAQLEELKKLMQKKLDTAVEKAMKAAAFEKEIAVKEAEQKVKEKAEVQLNAAQKKADQAVEREKIKMRKLVKALAEREKKLIAQAEQEHKVSATRVSTGSAKEASRQGKIETVRGPVK